MVFALKLYHFVEAFGILTDNVMFTFNELLLESCIEIFSILSGAGALTSAILF